MTTSLANIQAIAFDVDGVLTDGSILWGPSGEEWKRFHFTDIMGLSLARRAGIIIALISGENSPLIDRYAQKLRIQHIYKGTRDKATALRDFSTNINVPLANICVMGDDINDLPAMQIAGISAAPTNACPEVLAHIAATSGFACTLTGGNGAARQLTDAILSASNLHPLHLFLNVP
jgi:3-deoxy-D-manno-octulosonate 8-phosphate phosphatase (KDO 8-P phosphatase)